MSDAGLSLKAVLEACSSLRAVETREEVKTVSEAAHARLASLPEETRADAQTLARLVATLVDERAALRGERDAATNARELLLASVSHDLRNPLNTFAMSMGLLRDDLEREPIDGKRELALVARMDRALARMQRLIEDLLEASRITGRKIDLALRAMSAADLVRTATPQAEVVAKDRGAALKIGALDESARVTADPARGAQMVTSLAAYAARVVGESAVVELSVERGVAGVCFIARAARRSGGSLAAVSDGRGAMALLIARGIAAMHGGELLVTMTNDVTITATLPAV